MSYMKERGEGSSIARNEVASLNRSAKMEQDLSSHQEPGPQAPFRNQERLSFPDLHFLSTAPFLCLPAHWLSLFSRQYPPLTNPFLGPLFQIVEIFGPRIPNLQGRGVLGPAWSPGCESIPEKGEKYHSLGRIYLYMYLEVEPQIPRIWRKKAVPRKLEDWAHQLVCGCLSNSQANSCKIYFMGKVTLLHWKYNVSVSIYFRVIISAYL